MVQYGTEVGDVPRADRAHLEVLAPHATRAIELHRLTQPLRAKYNAALAVLDMIDLPILIFGADGTIILKKPRCGGCAVQP